MLALLLALDAHADNISARCQGIPKPADYNDQVQNDFLANYYALALTLSPGHAAIPHEAGRGAAGVDLLVLPPLSCARQFVMGHTKTENTNFTPVAPRLRVTFAFPEVGATHFYAGAAYVPPVPMFGTRNVILGGEVGAGWRIGKVDLGLRGHAELVKTVGEIATPFVAGDPAVSDFYEASTVGLDGMASYTAAPQFRPYVAIGALDASTYFWVGDDGVVVDNQHPYLGPAFSLGFDGLVKDHLRYALEGYAAPGGYSVPSGMPATDPNGSFVQFGNTGRIWTARARIAWEI